MPGRCEAMLRRGILDLAPVFLVCGVLILTAGSGCTWSSQASSGAPKAPTNEAADQPYLTTLKSEVNKNWAPPDVQITDGDAPTVRVSFAVQRSGTITNLRVLRSSSLPAVDQSALEAVRLSDPFAQLPDAYSHDRVEVTIDFTVKQ